ncbi:MAG TPA: hypothetical protein PKY96_13460, partial [Flavobacteriales bacterium]|nr:hypothetical protein [Flavobacteriales bacterium]
TTLNGSSNPCATIGIDERALPSPQVAPNPSAELFTVDLPEALQDAQGWETRDITGRLVDQGRVAGARFVIHAG